MAPPTPGRLSVLSDHETEDFVVDVHHCGGINGWFWVDLIHSTCRTSAHDTNKQRAMAGLAKNASSGPTIGAVRVGGFCRLKMVMGGCSPGGLSLSGVYYPEWSQPMHRSHPYNKQQWRKLNPLDQTIEVNARERILCGSYANCRTRGVRGCTT